MKSSLSHTAQLLVIAVLFLSSLSRTASSSKQDTSGIRDASSMGVINREELDKNIKKILKKKYHSYLNNFNNELWIKAAQETTESMIEMPNNIRLRASDFIPWRLGMSFTLWESHKETIIAQAMLLRQHKQETSSYDEQEMSNDEASDDVIESREETKAASCASSSSSSKKISCTDPACPITFGKKPALVSHMKNVHDPLRPIPCPYHPCTARFTGEVGLRVHTRFHEARGH